MLNSETENYLNWVAMKYQEAMKALGSIQLSNDLDVSTGNIEASIDLSFWTRRIRACILRTQVALDKGAHLISGKTHNLICESHKGGWIVWKENINTGERTGNATFPDKQDALSYFKQQKGGLK